MDAKTNIKRFVTAHGRRIAVKTVETRTTPSKRRTNQHFGCPLEWVRRISPLVKSKDQLLVAIWLYRRRAVCQRDLFDVPNETLRTELGLSRKAKYRALHHLEKVGIIALVRDGKHAIQVRILQ
jgi:hypothetical protein